MCFVIPPALRSFFFAVGACASLATSQAAEAWTLVWADEFQQADGTAPDSAKWVFDQGGNGWGNNELQTNTARRSNSRIEDGKLVVEAHQETYTGSDGIQRAYTSARLKTLGKASWQYGRMEARLKLPGGQGLWPAFWTLGTNFATIGWPACGEIDIMEHIGREPAEIYGTVHGPGYSGGNGIGGSLTVSNSVSLTNDFHLFAVEWDTNRIRWFMDNQPYFTVTRRICQAERRGCLITTTFCRSTSPWAAIGREARMRARLFRNGWKWTTSAFTHEPTRQVRRCRSVVPALRWK